MIRKTVEGREYESQMVGELHFDQEPKEGSFNPVTSDAVAKIADGVADIDAIVPEGASEENKLATAADVSGVQEDVDTIEGKIPSDTSTTNKLVNESGLQDAIDNASESWSTGFTPKGESSVSELNDLATQSNGDSYIVTDSGTLTDGTLEVVAGDQVAWDATNSVWYKLPQYALQSTVDNISNKADVAAEKMSFADVVTKSVLLESAKTDGGFLQTDGTINANVNWHMYSLNVKEGQVFDIQSSSGVSAKAYIFLDGDDNVVEYEENAPSSISSRWVYGVIVPSGATRMVVNTNSTTIEILIHYGTPNHKFVDYGGVASFAEKASIFSDSLGKEIRFNISSFFGYKTKDFTEDLTDWTLVEGKFYNRNTNAEASNASWNYYQKSVVPGETYKVTAAAGSAAPLWIIKDYNGNIISASSIADIGNNTETVVVPYGAVTIICNSRISSGDTPFVAAKKEIVIDAKNLELSSENKSRNILYGKTLVCCGDSITYGADIGDEGIVATPTIEMYQRVGSSFESVTANARASYGYQIAAANSMKFYNDGVGGSCVESLPDQPAHGFSMENGRYTTLPDDIDYLTIWFGWNDYAYGSLGTITDNVRTTFYGAYNIVLPYLIDKYPFTKICLCVPFGTSADMRQAVRNLGNKWGLAVFDFYGPQTPLYYGKEDSVGVLDSIVTANRAKFQATSAHPNFRGQTQISNMLEAFLRTI